MVQEPVQKGRCQYLVSQQVSPLGKAGIRGQNDRAVLVARCDQFEKVTCLSQTTISCSLLRRSPINWARCSGAGADAVSPDREALASSACANSARVVNSTECRAASARSANARLRWVFPVPGGPGRCTLGGRFAQRRVSASSRSLRSESMGWKEKSKASNVFLLGKRAALSRRAVAFCSRPASSAAKTPLQQYFVGPLVRVEPGPIPGGELPPSGSEFSFLYAPFMLIPPAGFLLHNTGHTPVRDGLSHQVPSVDGPEALASVESPETEATVVHCSA